MSPRQSLVPTSVKSLNMLDLWKDRWLRTSRRKGHRASLPNPNGNWLFLVSESHTWLLFVSKRPNWRLRNQSSPLTVTVVWPSTASKLCRKPFDIRRMQNLRNRRILHAGHSSSHVYWGQYKDLVHPQVFIELKTKHEARGLPLASISKPGGMGYPFKWTRIPKFSSLGFFFLFVF